MARRRCEPVDVVVTVPDGLCRLIVEDWCPADDAELCHPEPWRYSSTASGDGPTLRDVIDTATALAFGRQGRARHLFAVENHLERDALPPVGRPRFADYERFARTVRAGCDWIR